MSDLMIASNCTDVCNEVANVSKMRFMGLLCSVLAIFFIAPTTLTIQRFKKKKKKQSDFWIHFDVF